jgi:predicted DNA-binding transcriptional regulator AlpA
MKDCSMAVQIASSFRPKAAVSVTAMAKAIGLSRSRFYDYVKRGVFPHPVYSLTTRRPFFDEEMQEQIVAARQNGIGCNGEYILFYERRADLPVAPQPAPKPHRQSSYASLMDGLRSLGLTSVTVPQVEGAIASAYQNGTAGIDESVVLRTVYRHLRRQGVG